MEKLKLGSCPFCGNFTLQRFEAIDTPRSKRVYDLKEGDEFKMWGVFVAVVKREDGKLFYRYLDPDTQQRQGAKKLNYIGANGKQKVEIR